MESPSPSNMSMVLTPSSTLQCDHECIDYHCRLRHPESRPLPCDRGQYGIDCIAPDCPSLHALILLQRDPDGRKTITSNFVLGTAGKIDALINDAAVAVCRDFLSSPSSCAAGAKCRKLHLIAHSAKPDETKHIDPTASSNSSISKTTTSSMSSPVKSQQQKQAENNNSKRTTTATLTVGPCCVCMDEPKPLASPTLSSPKRSGGMSQQSNSSNNQNDDDDDANDDDEPDEAEMQIRKAMQFCGIICSRGTHYTCNRCLSAYIQKTWADIQPDPGVVPDLKCPNAGCQSDPFTDSDVARHSTDEALGVYFNVRQSARDAMAFAKAQEMLREAMADIESKKRSEAERQMLQEQLRRQFGGRAFQCTKCGYGPLLHEACSNLMTHHGDDGDAFTTRGGAAGGAFRGGGGGGGGGWGRPAAAPAGGGGGGWGSTTAATTATASPAPPVVPTRKATIDNSCKWCGHLPRDTSELERWDGFLRTPEELAARCKEGEHAPKPLLGGFRGTQGFGFGQPQQATAAPAAAAAAARPPVTAFFGGGQQQQQQQQATPFGGGTNNREWQTAVGNVAAITALDPARAGQLLRRYGGREQDAINAFFDDPNIINSLPVVATAAGPANLTLGAAVGPPFFGRGGGGGPATTSFTGHPLRGGQPGLQRGGGGFVGAQPNPGAWSAQPQQTFAQWQQAQQLRALSGQPPSTTWGAPPTMFRQGNALAATAAVATPWARQQQQQQPTSGWAAINRDYNPQRWGDDYNSRRERETMAAPGGFGVEGGGGFTRVNSGPMEEPGRAGGFGSAFGFGASAGGFGGGSNNSNNASNAAFGGFGSGF